MKKKWSKTKRNTEKKLRVRVLEGCLVLYSPVALDRQHEEPDFVCETIEFGEKKEKKNEISKKNNQFAEN